MDLSINLEYFMKRNNGGGRPGYVNTLPEFSFEESLNLAKEIGYKKIDFNGHGVKDTEKARFLLDRNNIKVNQSHGPDNYYAQGDFSEFGKTLLSSIKTCQKLGSEIFVVHGNQADRSKPYNKDAVLEFNYRLYSPVVEFAAQHNMKVAFENVMSFKDFPCYGSTPEELITLVEKFGDKNTVGICWDLGHGNVMFDPFSVEEMEKTADWLISTHIHDNYFGSDMHGIPFTGNLDWEKVMKTLKKINYKGDFTFEFVYKNYPDALFKDIMQFAFKAGNYLLSL